MSAKPPNKLGGQAKRPIDKNFGKQAKRPVDEKTEKTLPKRLQPALKALEKDLLERAKLPEVERGLRVAWEDEKKSGETGQGFDPWRRARVTQLAAAWVLSVVFVRTLEDRHLIDPRLAGPDADALARARDREASFVQLAPFLGPREYLLTVFRELAQLPGAREVFDTQHNPVWVLAPSSEGARALLDVFQQVDAETGVPAFTFAGSDTRFLGDLYQDLSESVRKRYALLQTPDFVERFILEQTLTPAIETFGLAQVRLIDPTCGSGHFLLGAFRELLAAWQAQELTTPVETLAQRALDQVHGVDLNPYAVAIARFRLVLAVLEAVGIERLDRAPALRPQVVVADSLLHRERRQQGFAEWVDEEESQNWGDGLFRLSDRGAVAKVLRQRYHAVVGNPPYIVEKDAVKKTRYRKDYAAATFEVPLGPPFVERFFELSIPSGYVGVIVSNAFTKRDSGRALIQDVLPRLDVDHLIDTSGCYLPGHGTPTLLLFGRNRTPSAPTVVAVLGKRGEKEVPARAASAPVWSEIVHRHQTLGWDGPHISVESIPRPELRDPPWILAGGGARHVFKLLNSKASLHLSDFAQVMGAGAVTRADDVFILPARFLQMPEASAVEYVTGAHVRDWNISTALRIALPYQGAQTREPADLGEFYHLAWRHRSALWLRRGKGFQTKLEQGGQFYEYSMYYPERYSADLRLSYPYVATHNHFVLSRGGKVFNKHAPVIILKDSYGKADHQALLGYLNSSTVGFWCRLVMFPKGIVQAGESLTMRKAPWLSYLEYSGNLLQQLPVPALELLTEQLLELVVAAEQTVQAMAAQAAEPVVAATLAATPSLAALREARARSLAERARLRGVLVSLQEEMDWRVYGIFGLPTLTAASVDEVRVSVEPQHRPFEVRLAREVATDISASEWFRIHKREAPTDVGGPLAELYRQRLRLLDDPERGRWLRLLETPETKRRWSPPDDAKAFKEAVRCWLLERHEALFRDQPTPTQRTARQLAHELGP
ncbi:MAG: BREX-2 system adenine-specific DNA-methyltransferase PglX, partial [Myxococcota bacterium]|nr:BREX-2 system adenine-specific DNA-methyltransferase PglX [Myxococcota bacterium]